MALSRSERFTLKTRIVEVMKGEEWDLSRQELLLAEFDREPLLGGWGQASFIDRLRDIGDEDLVEMYSAVSGVMPAEVETDVRSTYAKNWKSGHVQLFLSHSDSERDLVREVAELLEPAGIHGFVANDSMEFDKPWQDQMEQALQSMQVFVALVNPQFLTSPWCNQEVGWALGRRIPKYVVRMGVDPRGFLERDQWPTAENQTANDIANLILGWICSVPELGDTLTHALFTALRNAPSFIDAGIAAHRITALGALDERKWQLLAEAFWSNDQAYNSGSAYKYLRPFYAVYGRQFPPSKTDPVSR